MTDYFCLEAKLPFDLDSHREIARAKAPLEDLETAKSVIRLVSERTDTVFAVMHPEWNILVGAYGDAVGKIDALAFDGVLYLPQNGSEEGDDDV